MTKFISLCIKNDINGVKKLLKNKFSDLNFVNELGYTAAHYICFYGYTELMDVLKYKIDLEIKNNLGKTPFLISVERNHYNMVYLLLNIVDISTIDNNGENALIKACKNNNISIIKLLLSTNNEEEIWFTIEDIQNLYQYASKKNFETICEYLEINFLIKN